MYDLRTPGLLADFVREQPAEEKPGTIVLTFVTPERRPLPGIRYMLRGAGRIGSSGVGGRAITVPAGGYALVVLDPRYPSRSIGTIKVAAGETLQREFVLRPREQWQHDDVSRRVVKELAAELRIAESEVMPSSPALNPGTLRSLQKLLDVELNLPQRGTWTPQQLVDAVRDAIRKASAEPVPVLLRWVMSNGTSLDGMPYEIAGGGRTYRGVAGKVTSVPPGEYKVTALDPKLAIDVERIAVGPGQPYERTFRVEVPGAPEPGAELRRLSVRLKAAGQREEIWVQTAPDVWYRGGGLEAVPSPEDRLTIEEKTTVGRVRGKIVQEVNGRQFFIPDENMGLNISVRENANGSWKLYGTIQTAAAAQ